MRYITFIIALLISSLVSAYSLPDVCVDIHDDTAHKVTMTTTFQAAIDQLFVETSGGGGVIEIPYGNYRCDSGRISWGKTMTTTIRGLPNDEGNLPRFHCRHVERGGDITAEEYKSGAVPAAWLGVGIPADRGDTPNNDFKILVENIEVDGYPSAFASNVVQSVAIRNSLLHGAYGDMLYTTSFWDGQSTDVSFCGNIMKESGGGNSKHINYTHRTEPQNLPFVTGRVKLTVVDNVISEAYQASGIKSTANVNVVVGNTFMTRDDWEDNPPGLDVTDPSTFPYMNMHVDLMACSQNIIANNTFIGYYPNTAIGEAIVGIRNRKDSIGCDVPKYYSPEFTDPAFWESVVAGGMDTTGNPPAAIANPHLFNTFVFGNKFKVTGKHGPKIYAVQGAGTRPASALFPFSNSHVIRPWPESWVERSIVWMAGNTFDGIDEEHRYRSYPPIHCHDNPVYWAEKCGLPPDGYLGHNGEILGHAWSPAPMVDNGDTVPDWYPDLGLTVPPEQCPPVPVCKLVIDEQTDSQLTIKALIE